MKAASAFGALLSDQGAPMAYRPLTKDQHIALANSIRAIKSEITSLTVFVGNNIGKSQKHLSGLRKAENGINSAASHLENIMFQQLGDAADGLGFPHYNSQSLTKEQQYISLKDVAAQNLE